MTCRKKKKNDGYYLWSGAIDLSCMLIKFSTLIESLVILPTCFVFRPGVIQVWYVVDPRGEEGPSKVYTSRLKRGDGRAGSHDSDDSHWRVLNKDSLIHQNDPSVLNCYTW